MSLKLYRAIPVTFNSLKTARILFTAPEFIRFVRSPFKKICSCTTFQSRSYSTEDVNKYSEKQKQPLKRVYSGLLAPHIRAVKLFSLSSSIVGIAVQPVLYKEIVATANMPIILSAYAFIGFFTVLTPVLLHLITRKYVLELLYNERSNTYVARTLNFFCIQKETEFKIGDVFVPEVPGMFVTFNAKSKPLFVDPRNFDNPEHYAKIMGFDKPMDFKLYDTECTKEGNTSTASTSSNANK